MSIPSVWWGVAGLLVLSSCTVVRPGQVGVKQTLGKIKYEPLEPGVRTVMPFTQKVIKVPTNTVNIEQALSLPSKEGLTVGAEISILYHINGEQAPDVIENIGRVYEQEVIVPVFRSAAADVSSKFFAKDMHTGERDVIEERIRDRMRAQLDPRGIVIEAVLLKSIRLPDRLSVAISEKLEAEQDAQRMEFVLQKERQEAERKRVEAEGIRDAQRIISEGLTPLLIQREQIEAFRELATSPNAKVIVTDGQSPPMILEAPE